MAARLFCALRLPFVYPVTHSSYAKVSGGGNLAVCGCAHPPRFLPHIDKSNETHLQTTVPKVV